MRISGFTFVRNAIDLYYPIIESIRSALPICDEFIVAAGDSTDETTEAIRRIGDPKIKIIETVWDRERYVAGAINADQTNVALNACTGDWCLYLQADEVLHEAEYQPLIESMERHLADQQVEGLLFDYLHFFADYDHYMIAHGWYPHEIRIVRNGIGIQSWHDAQGFRRNGEKLKVAKGNARVFHYGWVRPPDRMRKKVSAFNSLYIGEEAARNQAAMQDDDFCFGSLDGRARYAGTHPAVMSDRIAAKFWEVKAGPPSNELRQDRFKNRLLSFLENRILGFRVGQPQNYKLLRR